MIRIALIMLFAFLQAPASALCRDIPPLAQSRPGGPWQGVVAEQPQPKFPTGWSLRSGIRKGVRNQILPAEIQAGPDIAVLKNGMSHEWPGLLASFREASVPADPGSVADLRGHKPLLIIPSGGLAGLGSSGYFRAGLAEYVRAGGIVLCFSQRQGADLAALPVPERSPGSVAGVGWEEDHGPLYRASFVQTRHPALTAARKARLSLETDGYLTVYPADSTVLLVRQDGFPTLLLYPFGNGWIAVTTLMSDLSFSQGLLETDERLLVQNLVLWAKSGGRAADLQPGTEASFRLRIRGPEDGIAASAQVRLAGPAQEKPLDERIVQLTIAAGAERELPYAFTVPQNAPPGIYHAEYVLMDERNRAITVPAESGEGWFVVAQPAAPPAAIPRSQPLSAAPFGIAVNPRTEWFGDHARLTLEVARTSGPVAPHDLIARASGQEKEFRLSGDRATVVFERIPWAEGRQLSYALAAADGRSLVRGGLDPAPAAAGNVAADRTLYRPGQTVRISVTGMGLGAITINGLGTPIYDHISADKVYELPVPANVPAGFYPIAWEFQTRTGGRRQGQIPVFVDGLRVQCSGSDWKPAAGGGILGLKLRATGKADVSIRTTLRAPSGKEFPGASTTATLVPGPNDLAVNVPFLPSEAGLWQLHFEVLLPLPEGPGFPEHPLTAAAGSQFIDGGSVAVLALATDRPVYYEPAGAVTISGASFAAAAGAKMELFLDGKRVRRDKLQAGAASFVFSSEGLSPGPHRATIEVSGAGPASTREVAFLFGTRLPDLGVSIQTSDLRAPAMEVGVGVTNHGKTASKAAKGELYEGNPAQGGVRIGAFSVPPLPPGQQHVVIFPWNLGGKAGPRILTAVAEQDQGAPETARENNRAEARLEIPDVLLTLMPRKNEFAADDEISYQLAVANFTERPLPLLTVNLEVADPSGKTVLQQSIPLNNLESGGLRELTRGLGPGIPQEGIYLISAQAWSDRQLASDSTGIAVLPTLAVKGSLEATPQTAAPCGPLEIRYTVRNTGNLPVTGGSVKIEIRSKQQEQIVHAIQLPFTLGEQTHRIRKVDFPRGDYLVTLRASVTNQQAGLNADTLLDERPLVVAGPLDLSLAQAAFPRILVWSGGETETSIERALLDKMLREAIDEEGYYSKIVTSAEAFSREALSGTYNTYLLIDIGSILDTAETLRTVLSRGHGVILAGSSDRMRSLAEQFGFRFEAAAGASYLTFPPGSPLRLGGNVPHAGPGFFTSRTGAPSEVLAVFSNDQPAVLAGPEGTGKMVVMPLSLVRSALAAGTSTLYSFLLRSTLLAAVPEQEVNPSAAALQMTVSAKAAPVKAQIVVRLPEGAKFFWANRTGAAKNGEVVFDLTAGPSAQRIIVLYHTGRPASRKPSVEGLYECGGTYVSQGKLE